MTLLALPYFLENARDLEVIGVVLGVIFWFQMLRHCALFESDSRSRFFWLALMICVPGVGSLIYFLTRVARRRV